MKFICCVIYNLHSKNILQHLSARSTPPDAALALIPEYNSHFTKLLQDAKTCQQHKLSFQTTTLEQPELD